LRLAQVTIAGVDPKVHMAADNDTAMAIAKYRGVIGPDPVAVGIHGRSVLSHKLMGSTVERIVHRSERLVVVVRAGMGTAVPFARPPPRIRWSKVC
jgi:nucleotide-binding universal stress UspA family protein